MEAEAIAPATPRSWRRGPAGPCRATTSRKPPPCSRRPRRPIPAGLAAHHAGAPSGHDGRAGPEPRSLRRPRPPFRGPARGAPRRSRDPAPARSDRGGRRAPRRRARRNATSPQVAIAAALSAVEYADLPRAEALLAGVATATRADEARPSLRPCPDRSRGGWDFGRRSARARRRCGCSRRTAGIATVSPMRRCSPSTPGSRRGCWPRPPRWRPAPMPCAASRPIRRRAITASFSTNSGSTWKRSPPPRRPRASRGRAPRGDRGSRARPFPTTRPGRSSISSRRGGRGPCPSGWGSATARAARHHQFGPTRTFPPDAPPIWRAGAGTIPAGRTGLERGAGAGLSRRAPRIGGLGCLPSRAPASPP